MLKRIRNLITEIPRCAGEVWEAIKSVVEANHTVKIEPEARQFIDDFHKLCVKYSVDLGHDDADGTFIVYMGHRPRLKLHYVSWHGISAENIVRKGSHVSIDSRTNGGDAP